MRLGESPCSMSGLSNLLPLRCLKQSASSVSEGGTTSCHPRTHCGLNASHTLLCLAQPSPSQSVCWGVYTIPSFWMVWISSTPSFYAYLFVCILSETEVSLVLQLPNHGDRQMPPHPQETLKAHLWSYVFTKLTKLWNKDFVLHSRTYAHVCVCVWRGQRTTCWNQFSPPSVGSWD